MCLSVSPPFSLFCTWCIINCLSHVTWVCWCVFTTDASNTHLADRAELMLQSARNFSLHSQTEVLRYLGSRFR